MPLLFAPLNQPLRIVKIRGSETSAMKHLAALGVTQGGVVTLLDNAKGCAVIKVKESRLALDHSVSMAIEVEIA